MLDRVGGDGHWISRYPSVIWYVPGISYIYRYKNDGHVRIILKLHKQPPLTNETNHATNHAIPRRDPRPPDRFS